MDGMGMMLKAFGIDAEQIQGAASQVQKTATEFLARLDRIERKMDFLAPSLVDGEELARYFQIGGPGLDSPTGGAQNGGGDSNTD